MSRDELLTHHHGGDNGGVDASGDDSSLQQSSETGLQIDFHDDDISVSKLDEILYISGFLGRRQYIYEGASRGDA